MKRKKATAASRRRQLSLPLKRRVTFSVAEDLLAKAELALADRGTTLQAWLALQVGALTNIIKSAAGLADAMPFGKYVGARVEDVVRGDPRYIKWCLDTCPERLKPDVVELYTELSQ